MNADDIRVIACNLTESISEASAGSLAYVRWLNRGWDSERLPLLLRSRGGRWIEKWEDLRRLGTFRMKTIPPEHPLYARLVNLTMTENELAELQSSYARVVLGMRNGGL